jgi:hypothetical protein
MNTTENLRKDWGYFTTAGSLFSFLTKRISATDGRIGKFITILKKKDFRL